MGGTRAWRISTGEGVSLDSAEFVDVLAVHHRRLVSTWQGFAPAQWEHPSRNAAWTVHHTVRHVADGTERVAGVINGHPVGLERDFDPRSTPAAWLDASNSEVPSATIERFDAASASLRTGIGDRARSGDSTHDRTVYGTAHWTVNVAHLLWDSWLHERDVLLPLGRPAPCSEEEERLVGLYALLMALVPSMRFGRPTSVTVQLGGIGVRTIEASCDDGVLVSAEVPGVAAGMSGDLAAAVDALAGRGSAVADALPGAPEELGFLAAFFTG